MPLKIPAQMHPQLYLVNLLYPSSAYGLIHHTLYTTLNYFLDFSTLAQFFPETLTFVLLILIFSLFASSQYMYHLFQLFRTLSHQLQIIFISHVSALITAMNSNGLCTNH